MSRHFVSHLFIFHALASSLFNLPRNSDASIHHQSISISLFIPAMPSKLQKFELTYSLITHACVFLDGVVVGLVRRRVVTGQGLAMPALQTDS